MYVIRNSGLELVAVLIEAKHTTNSALKHAIAQVMGYFAAFADTIQTPLVFVMTEQQIKLVLYPFTRTTGPQINAAICLLVDSQSCLCGTLQAPGKVAVS